MKKSKLKHLQLNKTSITSLNTTQKIGGVGIPKGTQLFSFIFGDCGGNQDPTSTTISDQNCHP